MNPKLNMIDRIMMPVLALTSLVIMIASYPAGYDGTPAAPLWGFAIVGFAYVLYQAIRVGSPGLTAATAAVVMVGYLGPGLVNWRSADDYLRNTIWNPLGHYSLASIAMTIVLVAIFALPLEVGVFAAWIVQRLRKGRPAPLPPPLPPGVPPPLVSGSARAANSRPPDSP